MNTKIESKKWELNFLGEEWQYEGETEEEAEAEFLKQMNKKTREKYEEYCEDIGVNPEMVWTEVK
jgi:hypothetical protein